MKKENKKSNRKVRKIAAALVIFFYSSMNVFAANSMSTDSYSFTVTSDDSAPAIINRLPASGENNVSRTTNIKFSIADDLSGVDNSTIDLKVNNVDIVTNGVAQTYLNRAGSTVQHAVEIIEKNSREYVVVYDPAEYFDYKQTVQVVINADDLEGNQLQSSTYSFKVQNFVHGMFQKLNGRTFTAQTQTTLSSVNQDNSCIQTSFDGKNVYAAWEELSSTGQWNIYFSRSTDFGDSFGTPVKVNPDAAGVDHRYPATDIDDNNNVYIAWQQQSQSADWNIYIATMVNGETAFSSSYLIYNDSGLSDQLYPTIAVGTSLTNDGNSQTLEPASIYVMWLDDNGTQKIVNFTRTTASYSDAWYKFVSNALRVDDVRWPQVCADPVIRIDADKDIFAAWRGVNVNGTSSIYFDHAASTAINAGESFSADVVVSNATANGKGPDIAVSADGSNVFVLWKELSGSTATLQFYKYLYSQAQGIYGLNLSSQVNQTALTEDTLYEYSLAVNNDNDAFVVWSYENGSSSIINMAGAFNGAYQFEEYTEFSTTGDQIKPYLVTDSNGTHFYVSWTDNSTGENEISFLRNTFMVTDQIVEQNISNSIGGTVKVGSGEIAGTSVAINMNSMDAPIDVTIAKIISSPEVNAEGFTKVGNTVDFGPGGTQFETAATITIPYTNAQLSSAGVTDESILSIYYYNLSTYSWEKVAGSIVDTASRVVYVPTTHFSIYTIGYTPVEAVETPSTSSASTGGSGGSGGGCFIATAAFGTKMAKEVRVLCEFRDKYLLTNYWGTKFVKFYYKYSPPIADRIRNNESAKAMLRLCLQPLIQFGKAVCK
ncbi:MAG: CFI-box-CTERM domain-containing protein [Candidatus Omnitrophota bacterium]